MNPADLQERFHQNADAKRFSNRIRNPFLWSKEQRLADLVARSVPRGAGRLLEVGCGEGSNLLYIQERLPGLELVGLDFSLQKLRFLDQCGARSSAACGNALSLPFCTGQFDAVLYRDLLHHVNWARDQVLTEGLRVIKPEGVLIILESNGHAPLNQIFQLLYPAERGLRDSTSSKLLTLGRRLGKPTIEHVEASFLVRAIGFVIGWPEDLRRWLVRPLYLLACGWEKLVERLLPKHRWTYMMMSLRRS